MSPPERAKLSVSVPPPPMEEASLPDLRAVLKLMEGEPPKRFERLVYIWIASSAPNNSLAFPL